MISVLRSVLDNYTRFGACGRSKPPQRAPILPVLAVLGSILLAAPLLGQATQNTLIQPDIIIPFTFTAAGNFPATPTNNGAGDNRTKGVAAWVLKYQNGTGMTGVTVTLQSGCSTTTTVSFGTFAGQIPTTPSGNTNPIVSDTGGQLSAINGTACVSWVRVNVAATGTGTLTGVLYGFRNSSAAVNGGGGGGAPSGPAGGDLGGTYPNPTVVGINSKSLSGAQFTGNLSANSLVEELYVTAAPYYASGSATTTTTNGTFGVGTSGTVTSCSTFSANQGVFIAGAGAAGVDYVGTVVSCSGTTLTITPATSTSVATSTLVQHDDTTAFQSAVTALGTTVATGGRIMIPPGVYRINGPEQTTNSENCRICMPSIQGNADYSLPPAVPTIEFYGLSQTAYTANSGTTAATNGVILISQEAGGAIIGGAAAAWPTNGLTFTCVLLSVKNLTIRGPDNPSIGGIDTSKILMFDGYNLNFDTNSIWLSQTQPSHTAGFGLKMPGVGNYVLSSIRHASFTGLYSAIIPGEHTFMDDISAYGNLHGIEMSSSGGHGVHGDRVTLQGNVYQIYASTQTQTLDIDSLDLEHPSIGPAWARVTDDIYDPSNYLTGAIHWHLPSGTFTINGSAKISLSNLDAIQTLKSCTIDNDTQSATALVAANFSGKCQISQPATIVEVDVMGGTGILTGSATAPTVTGTGSVQIGLCVKGASACTASGSGTTGILSGALATVTGFGCARTTTSATCFDGTTSSNSITVSTTAIPAGYYLFISAATADAAQTWYNATIWFTVN